MMSRQEAIELIQKVADPSKVDPVDPKIDFITVTPEELVRFAQHVGTAAAWNERQACADKLDDEGWLAAATLIRARGTEAQPHVHDIKRKIGDW